MHVKRWITAIILLPPLVLLILKGTSLVFGLVVTAVALVTLWEYYRIVFQDHHPRVPLVYSLWGYINCALIMMAAMAHRPDVMLAPLAVNVFGAALLSIFRFKTTSDAPVVVVKQTFGLIYIAFFLAAAVLLHQAPAGGLWVLFLLGLVALGDTGAFYAGTYFGRHKLCPAVSPKKSIEGAVGGLAASVIFVLIFRLAFPDQISPIMSVGFALIVGVLGQAGDLFASEFKRAAGVKDSSSLLPGHGGFLDRLDALLLALPTGYLLKELLLS